MLTKTIAAVAILICFGVGAAQEPKVELPRGAANATADSALLPDSAVIVSIPANDRIYVGTSLIPKDQLGAKVVELTEQRRSEFPIVFIAASANVDYCSLVETMQVMREHGLEHFGLVVNRAGASEVTRGIFLVEVPSSRDPNGDISRLVPNPLTLVASLSSDLLLRLNQERGPRKGELCFTSAPNGLGNEPDSLQKWLTCVFENRTKQHAYKIGMETRTDVALSDRIEKTVFIKAPLSVKYGDVVRVVNAVKGAGASPIGLQLDDLPN
jgi:biopolymer transport protein ExbD/biopolymer transport protein TolR